MIRVVACIVALALAAPVSGLQTLAPGELASQVRIDQELGAALPLDARFVDQDGRKLALGELFADRPVVLAFVYYRCPMLCTEVLNGLVRALKAMSLEPGSDFDVVVISIDPRETSELAAEKRSRYLALHGSDGGEGWHFLVGAEPEVTRATGAAGFRFVRDPVTDEYAHASGIMVATAAGVLSHYFYGVEYSPRDLRFALVEASEGKVGTLADAFLMLCFHYDPATGRYGFAIQSALRIACIGTVVALTVSIAWMRRRESARRPRSVEA
jgi:protein SCO1